MGKWKEQFLPEESFKSWSSYAKALGSTRRRFTERVFARSDEQKEITEVIQRSQHAMKKQLGWWDLLWFSIGAVVGSGIFVLTGQEANQTAGPAIIVSYAVAGISAMLSVFCYTEFAIEIPAAGGSFAYLKVELGDFVAFIGAANIILEYLVAGAAVARSWTCYFASLINHQCDDIVIHTNLAENYNLLDPIAVAVLIITGLVAFYSTKVTSYLNWISSFVNMAIILFVIVAGLIKGDSDNLTPFVPFGSRSIFQAASVLYFAYIGFDAVATMAEETRNPSRDVPIGLVGSMSIVTILYCLMALTLTRMLPYTQIDPKAGFSSAFSRAGWNWAKYVVALGALKGMTTVLLVSAVGEARYLTHIARTHLIPPWFAVVNERTRTPINATVVMVLATCVLAFFTELSILANLLSISTLFIFMLVAIGILVRRYYKEGESTTLQLSLLVSFILLIIGSNIGIAAFYATVDGWKYLYILFIGLWVFATLGLQLTLPQVKTPRVWGVPLVPWFPSVSIAFNVFLMGTIDTKSFIRFGVWTGICLVYYFLFGLHASYDTVKQAEAQAQSLEEGTKSVDHGNKDQVDVTKNQLDGSKHQLDAAFS